MLCWEASISLPRKHPSRLKWQAKACKNLLLTPFSQARSKSPSSSPSPVASLFCCLGELLQLSLGTAEGDDASPLGSRGNQSQPGSSEIPQQIPSLLPRQLPQFIPLEKQGIPHLGHIQQLHSGMLQVPGADTHRCAQLWGKTLLQQGNDQEQDHGWVYAAQTISCRAAGTTHSLQAASTDLTLGISAIHSQDCRLQEPRETSTELSSWLDLQLALGLLLCICTSSLLPLSQRYSPGCQLQQEVMGMWEAALPEHSL